MSRGDNSRHSPYGRFTREYESSGASLTLRWKTDCLYNYKTNSRTSVDVFAVGESFSFSPAGPLSFYTFDWDAEDHFYVHAALCIGDIGT